METTVLHTGHLWVWKPGLIELPLADWAFETRQPGPQSQPGYCTQQVAVSIVGSIDAHMGSNAFSTSMCQYVL